MVRTNHSRVALSLAVAVTLTLAGARDARATVYAGNGATGFGGPVGTGALTITDNAAGDITFSFQPGAGHPSVDGNSLVIYLSTGTPGLVDTRPLIDIGDSGRRAISGYNHYGPDLDDTRSVIEFPSGFQATYALSMEGGYVGLFQLPPADGDGGLTYINGGPQSGNPLHVTLPLANLGLTQGQSFRLLGTLIDGNAAYRSNETIGTTSPDIGLGGNPGFNNLITFSSDFTYQTTIISTSTQWALATGGSWNTVTNWTAGVPNSAGAAAVLGNGPGITSSQTVTLDGSKTVGTLAFDNAAASYTVAAGTGGTLTINNTGGPAGSTAGIAVTAGSHFISAPIQMTAGMTVNSAAGTQMTLSGGVGGSGDLTVSGAGTLHLGGASTYTGDTSVNGGATLNANGSLPSTAINANGHVNFAANSGAGILVRSQSAINLTNTGSIKIAAPTAATARTVLVTGALNFGGSSASWQGLVDLGANDMIVRAGNVASIQSQLKQGLAGTAGITSSAAAATTTPKAAIGYAAIAVASTFDGQAVNAGDVVLKYTVFGDANLDSTVSFPDLVSLAQHYNETTTVWATGDFNYDGTTNFSDLVGLAQNYNLSLSTGELSQLGTSFAVDWALAQSLVPEPGTLTVVTAAMSLLARRRRQDRGIQSSLADGD